MDTDIKTLHQNISNIKKYLERSGVSIAQHAEPSTTCNMISNPPIQNPLNQNDNMGSSDKFSYSRPNHGEHSQMNNGANNNNGRSISDNKNTKVLMCFD